jgi:O-antigen ligase
MGRSLSGAVEAVEAVGHSVAMTARIAERQWMAVPLLAGCAVIYGALVAVAPLLAAGLVILGLALVLAFRFPAAHLTVFLLLTTVVPFSVQNALAGGGGPGLFLSDVLLATGVLRSVVVLLQRPLDRRSLAAATALLLFLAGVLAQFAHGVSLGADASQAGAEARALLGFGAFLLALPLWREPAARARLARGLVLVGLALGLWGLAQWVLNVEFGGTGDVGVRAGVTQTTAGRGQVQGGLYAFPVAIVLSSAVLMAKLRLSLATRLLLVGVVFLNVVSLLVTYERTFWVATVVGLAFVVVFAERMQRLKGIAWIVVLAAVMFATLSTLTPGVLTAARERFLSLGQYASDDSLRDRRVEGRHVMAEVHRRPTTGSGLAARIFWGAPWISPAERFAYYSHNGYLALAWKLGVPLTLLLLGLVAWAIVARGPPAPPADPASRALLNGARAGLLGVAIASVTFPAFTTLAVTAVIGLLMAICFSRA